MLVLFAFSVTPKKILHDLVATHTDYRTEHLYSSSTQKEQVHQSFINCKCEQLIVQSVFLSTISKYEIVEITGRLSFYQKRYSFSFNAIPENRGLRGPPTA